tara:strand:+ start:277 stop:714 length:438 start_codon:yes stop_codon:yes gene_type:complete
MKNLICTKSLTEELLGESKPASEMSIEELQEMITAKKLEESKPISEMSIGELKAVIKVATWMRPEVKKPVNTEPKKKPGNMWYVITILLGFIRGMIGYASVKNDDPHMAMNLLFVGIAATILVYFSSWSCSADIGVSSIPILIIC